MEKEKYMYELIVQRPHNKRANPANHRSTYIVLAASQDEAEQMLRASNVSFPILKAFRLDVKCHNVYLARF